MKSAAYTHKRGAILSVVVGSLAGLGLSALISFAVVATFLSPEVRMDITSDVRVLTVGDQFVLALTVDSRVPVNVFAGEILFDAEVLHVASIDYNTSIADLWAQRPWYSNGDGTLNFIGGTTKLGGFKGKGTLLTITFTAKREGTGFITIRDPHILRHDGFGSTARLEEPIDALFTVHQSETTKENLLSKKKNDKQYTILNSPPATDLNRDGEHSLADVSIFMLHIITNNMRSDFDADGDVTTSDLSILLDML